MKHVDVSGACRLLGSTRRRRLWFATGRRRRAPSPVPPPPPQPVLRGEVESGQHTRNWEEGAETHCWNTRASEMPQCGPFNSNSNTRSLLQNSVQRIANILNVRDEQPTEVAFSPTDIRYSPRWCEWFFVDSTVRKAVAEVRFELAGQLLN